jgi:hypothetical protein
MVHVKGRCARSCCSSIPQVSSVFELLNHSDAHIPLYIPSHRSIFEFPVSVILNSQHPPPVYISSSIKTAQAELVWCRRDHQLTRPSAVVRPRARVRGIVFYTFLFLFFFCMSSILFLCGWCHMLTTLSLSPAGIGTCFRYGLRRPY